MNLTESQMNLKQSFSEEICHEKTNRGQKSRPQCKIRQKALVVPKPRISFKTLVQKR